MEAVRAGSMALALLGVLSRSALAGEASITVEGPTTGCPGRGEVVAGLESRLPGVTAPRSSSQPAVRYRLEIGRAAGRAGLTLQLHEQGGPLMLERQLTPPESPTVRPTRESCQALAEAAALVVARYLREIGYRSPTPVRPPDEPRPPEPPPPAPQPAPASPPVPPLPAPARSPAPPRATPPGAELAVASAAKAAPASGSAGFLGAATAVRAAVDRDAPLRSELTISIQATRGWLAGELSGGVAREVAVAVPGSSGSADLRLRAFPLHAGIGAAFAALGGAIGPMAGLNLDLLSFQARGLVDARRGLGLEPAAELGLSYRAASRRLFVRGALWGAYSLAPRDFDAGGAAPVFRTPSVTFRAQIEAGLVLWKN
jgi:hypothetical protein